VSDSLGIQRINVVGTSGSGKSTFARALAQRLDLPYYELDQLFWKPGWQMSSDEELFAKVRQVTSQQRWILDGNYHRTAPEKWKHVQLVIWLDMPFLRTILQVSRRAVQRALSQEELWPGTGNRETLAKAFLSRESIIWWAITTYRANKRRYASIMRSPEYAHIRFVRLRTGREVGAFLLETQPHGKG
jgi:adenylate kinase family enzyme